MKVVGYIRVSTDEQARGGVSLGMQADRIWKYAESQGWTLARIYEDAGLSGTTMNRPALQKMLAALSGIGAILVYKVDRLSRRQKDVLSILEDVLEPAGVGLKSVTEGFDTTTAIGRALLGMLTVFAQLQRDTIAQRISEALRHKQRRGQHVGSVPFGYARTRGQLTPVEEEQSVVAEVRALRARGATLRECAVHLTSRGVPTRRRGRWSPEHVRLLLARTAA